MNHKAKQLLLSSINFFESIDDIYIKIKNINHVKNELKKHDKAIKNIGTRLSKDYVTAGKVFLRIYDK